MFNSYIDVLVIDDNEDFAKTCAKFIEKACNVKTHYTIYPENAEKIVKENLVKVIIFDQKMPKMTGVNLFKKLRTFDPHFKSILLTGEAALDEVTQVGFTELMVKDKDNHLLAFKILELLRIYYEDIIPINSQKPFYFKKIGLKHFVRYNIPYVYIVNDEFIKPESWDTEDEIRAGECKEIVIENQNVADKSFSESFKKSNDVNLNAQIGLTSFSDVKFSSAFANEIEKMTSYTQSNKLSQKKTWSISLPPEGNVAYERLETAPVYKKIRVFINTSFSWSQKSYMDSIDLFLPTNTIKGRIFRCYKDGTNEILDLQSYKKAK